MKHILSTITIATTLALASCTPKQAHIVDIKKIDIIALPTNANSEIGKYIDKYKTDKDAKMSAVLSYTDTDLKIAQHDSPLGNLIAQIILDRANTITPTDACITNCGGIRRNLYKGNITLGDIFEILPFDNTAVTLRFTGSQLQKVADAMAKKGGEAMAGISFDIVDNKAANIKINGKNLIPDKQYNIVTNNYLAAGNDRLEPMANHIALHDLQLNLRDIAIDFFTNLGAGKIQHPQTENTNQTAHQSNTPTTINPNTPTNNDQLQIIVTNDTHSQIEPSKGRGGYEARLRAIDSLRNINPNTILLDAGDMWQGSPYFNLYFGRTEVEGYNIMRYDAVTIGNHEFDHGLDTLAARAKEMKFPLLNANYNTENTPLEGLTKPYTVISRNNWRVGVIGVGINPDGLIPQDKYGNLTYGEPIDSVNKYAELLRHELNCDIVCVISHLGFFGDESAPQTDDYILSKKTRNVDLIMGGHTHNVDTVLNIQNLDKKTTTILQSSKYGRDMFLITFNH